VGHYNPLVILAFIALKYILLTQSLHKVAVAVIMTAVVLIAAKLLGSNPKIFVTALIIGTSAGFMMPSGHQIPMALLSRGRAITRLKIILSIQQVWAC